MKNKIPLRLWYEAEAPYSNECSKKADWRGGTDIGWERWSLPIGNGYFGANVFGRTDIERIQITDKTLQNPPTLVKDKITYHVGGLTSFSETYIDFGHKDVTDYKRYLDIETAIAGVEYTFAGVRYTREYFTSYPHRALVIKLDADKSGEVSFTLRPTNPYKQSYGGYEGDGVSRKGTVSSYIKEGIGTIELTGRLDFYGYDFCGIFRVYTDGGKVEADTVEHKYFDNDGSEKIDINGVIKVSEANSAFIVVTLDSNYELSSDIFTTASNDKPFRKKDIEYVRKKVNSYLKKIENDITDMNYYDAYAYLKKMHADDHSELFGRVSLELDTQESDIYTPTDQLLNAYKSGKRSGYLETLIFQYGRYLLIASSRPGTMPAHLQGAWNTYDIPPWSCGYWHNVNVQMNYWPAFSTNLAETFSAYSEYKNAYMKKAKMYADSIIKEHHSEYYGKDGGNGWVIGTDGHQVSIASDRSAGNLGFTTQLFWEHYLHTMDKKVLAEAYELLVDAARYITKCTVRDENGNYLVAYGDSPEMFVGGAWYMTKGTAYAQGFAYMNNYNALLAAKAMGINLEDDELLKKEEYSVLKTVLEQIDKYDPVVVGLSGQIKEFREEDYYCSFGDEYHHRHIAQIIGLYPANIINSTTPAWLDAATVTLDERGDHSTGWGLALRMNARARTKNGNRTYKLLNDLISMRTAENLWNLHPPFQIDGSFGVTAGVSEMLMQSHEGYIEPLAAIPSVWENGSFSGLIARGNFEISAEWNCGHLTSFKLVSRSGERAAIRYPHGKDAAVSINGSDVKFEELENNVIVFDTVKGGEYTVVWHTSIVTPEKPEGLGYERDGDGFSLFWNVVEGAKRYNIYYAEESSPKYTFIGATESTRFVIPTWSDEKRTTYVVTSVNECGAESERSICYRNPNVLTEYGTIPAYNADKPYAFLTNDDSGYRYIGSTLTFGEAIRAVQKIKNPVIYVTRDTVLEKSAENEVIPNNLTLDIGGRSLMLEGTLLPINVAKSGISIKIKNGRLLTMDGSVLYAYSSDDKARGKFDLDFENVTFGNEKYCMKTVPIFTSDKTISGSEALVNIKLRNCSIDYFIASESGTVKVFDLCGKKNGVRFSVTMKGGTVKMRNLARLEILPEKRDAEFIFTRGDHNERLRLKTTSVDKPLISLPTDEGELEFRFVNRYKIRHSVYCDYLLENKDASELRIEQPKNEMLLS